MHHLRQGNLQGHHCRDPVRELRRGQVLFGRRLHELRQLRCWNVRRLSRFYLLRCVLIHERLVHLAGSEHVHSGRMQSRLLQSRRLLLFLRGWVVFRGRRLFLLAVHIRAVLQRPCLDQLPQLQCWKIFRSKLGGLHYLRVRHVLVRFRGGVLEVLRGDD